MNESVKMVHPSIPDGRPAVVSRTAFNKVWQKLGWTVADDPGTAPEPTTIEQAQAPGQLPLNDESEED